MKVATSPFKKTTEQNISWYTGKKLCWIIIFAFIYAPSFIPKADAQRIRKSDTIIVAEGNEKLKLLGDKIYFLEDPEGTLEMEDILSPSCQARFQLNNQLVFQRPPTNNTYWLKMIIDKQTEEKLFVEIGTEFMATVDYYIAEQNSYQLVNEAGFTRPESNRPYPVNLYWFKLPDEKGIKVIYFRFFGEGPMEVPVQIGTLAQLYKNSSFNDAVFYAFLGAMLLMFGYNFLIYLSVRDSIYLIYLGYIFFALFVVSFFNNYQFVTYLFGEDNRAGMYYYHSIWVNPLFFFVGWFAIRFLNLATKLPVAKRILNTLNFLFILVYPLIELFHIIPSYVLTIILQITVLPFALTLLGSGFYLWLVKGENQARLYTLAWIGLIMSVFVTILTLTDILPYNFFTRNSSFFGIAWEILFFSLALGDRYNEIRKENIRILEAKSHELEIAVTERTLELKESHEELLQAYEEIQVNAEALEERNKDITDSINYGQRIQMAMLPTLESIQSYLPELFILFKPRDIVSGDFYYFAAIEHKLVIAAVDCTGHGIPGAFMSMIGNDILNNLVEVNRITEANIILNELHKGIRQVLKQQETNNKDGMDIALLVIDQENGVAEFAGARNPLVYIQNGEVHSCTANKLSIGGEQRERDRNFHKHIIPLVTEHGDKINTSFYLFTDGYQDQFGGPQRKKFMLGQMKSLFSEIYQKDMEEQKNILGHTIESWREMSREKQIDDILLIGFRI